jgi:hypothetical protein
VGSDIPYLHKLFLMQRGWDERLTYIQPIAFSFKNVETSERAASCMLSQVIGGESYSSVNE